MRLNYRSTDREGVSVHINELVPFVYTPTMFGGCRQWLRCLKCGRGAERSTAGEGSAVVNATAWCTPQRGNRRTSATSTAPTGSGSGLATPWGSAFEGDDFPPKPKRMRWKTYRRLEERYEDLQNQWAVGAILRLGLVQL